MAKSGLRHIDVGPELTKTEWESEESHELIHGTSFPSSPVERQLFYRDDEHKWYIYNGSAWVDLQGTGGGGMEVHGNEYHYPDFAFETDFLAHDSRHDYLGADELSPIRTISQRLMPFINKVWTDINGFTAGHTGTGGFTIGFLFGELYTGVTNNSEGIISDSRGFWQAYAAYGYSWGMKLSIRQGTTQTFWLGLLNIPTAPSLTQNHVAFYIDTDGNLWASSGNGTNGTQTDTGINVTGLYGPILSIYGNATGLYFYVNHVLKATHLLASSYYPDAVSCYFTMYIKNATDGATRAVFCYPLSMVPQFAY